MITKIILETKSVDLLIVLLTVLFVGLKLTNCIDWPWWLVISPLWIAAGIGILVLISVLMLYFMIK